MEVTSNEVWARAPCRERRSRAPQDYVRPPQPAHLPLELGHPADLVAGRPGLLASVDLGVGQPGAQPVRIELRSLTTSSAPSSSATPTMMKAVEGRQLEHRWLLLHDGKRHQSRPSLPRKPTSRSAAVLQLRPQSPPPRRLRCSSGSDTPPPHQPWLRPDDVEVDRVSVKVRSLVDHQPREL